MRYAIALLIVATSLLLSGCGNDKRPLTDQVKDAAGQAKDAAVKAKDKTASTVTRTKDSITNDAKERSDRIENFASDRLKP